MPVMTLTEFICQCGFILLGTRVSPLPVYHVRTKCRRSAESERILQIAHALNLYLTESFQK